MDMINHEDRDADLDEDATDYIVKALKALTALDPSGASGILADLFLGFIPGQRSDRLVSFLKVLAKELEAATARISNLEAIMRRPYSVELIETGAYQATRAVTAQRIEFIAKAVANGLSEDELQTMRMRRLLNLLQELDDEELFILSDHTTQGSFGNRSNGLRPKTPFGGDPPEVADHSAAFKLGYNHLERLGLMRRNTPKALPVSQGHVDLARMNKGFLRVTGQGHALLRLVGLYHGD